MMEFIFTLRLKLQFHKNLTSSFCYLMASLNGLFLIYIYIYIGMTQKPNIYIRMTQKPSKFCLAYLLLYSFVLRN